MRRFSAPVSPCSAAVRGRSWEAKVDEHLIQIGWANLYPTFKTCDGGMPRNFEGSEDQQTRPSPPSLQERVVPAPGDAASSSSNVIGPGRPLHQRAAVTRSAPFARRLPVPVRFSQSGLIDAPISIRGFPSPTRYVLGNALHRVLHSYKVNMALDVMRCNIGKKLLGPRLRNGMLHLL